MTRRPTHLCLSLFCLALLAACKPQASADAAAAVDPDTSATRTASPAASIAAVADQLNPLPSPRDEIKAAMDAFLAVRSFHATMEMAGSAMPDGMTTEMDFVAPDRYRIRMPMGTQVIIGDTMHMNVQGRTMKMPMPKGTLGQWRDPGKLAENQATMTVDAQGRETIDGVSARKYLVHNTRPQPTDVTMWIGDDDLPLQIRHSSHVQGKTVDATIRYSRYDDPAITIDPP
ncbi:hypothetical protein IP90_02319 [Luteimonas cucumeris]|uniref:Outer membrane lipoprotein-sorting protein n=1 Tax=Luteimonas cucumeris TaxID=985012 RepID=A0A562L259_9GAMM|nr:hypothetical protein [Luteimonas cucumeris]TWI01759.1 hypothetical protein IP90_02319 [Luteimonas cucumeris]